MRRKFAFLAVLSSFLVLGFIACDNGNGQGVAPPAMTMSFQGLTDGGTVLIEVFDGDPTRAGVRVISGNFFAIRLGGAVISRGEVVKAGNLWVFNPTFGAPAGTSFTGGYFDGQLHIDRIYHTDGVLLGFAARSDGGALRPFPWVADPVDVTGITKTSPTTVGVGGSITLAGTVAPANATNSTIVWSIYPAPTSPNATLSAAGVLTGVAVGTLVVRATVAGGATLTTPDGVVVATNFTQSFIITVVPHVAVTGITKTSPTTVAVGGDITLAGTVAPANATNSTIVWSIYPAPASPNATLSAAGVLTGVEAGTVQVRGTIVNGATATTPFNGPAVTITVTP
ncbi:MAG: hypothetical protein LBG93_06415 [Treponema sp.]|jgi:hypothetical protein|nr:hypothetical protein [Treponema sp.]